MEYPYDDGSLRYDRVSHKYVLTKECVFEELGINLDAILYAGGDANPSSLADRFLKRVSNTLYNFIYSFTMNKMYVEYVLAKYPPAREVIKDCLLNEVQYTLKSGELNQSGINMTKGTVIDRQAIAQRLVSIESERLLEQELPNGFCLLYRGYIRSPLGIKYREDY